MTTSSSDEAPKRQRMAKAVDIDDDINDLRRMMKQDAERCNDVSLHSFMQPNCNAQQQSDLCTELKIMEPQPHSYSQPQIRSELYTYSVPQTHSDLHTHSHPQTVAELNTQLQPQTVAELHTHSQPQIVAKLHTHSQPITVAELHTHSQPETQLDTHSQHENDSNTYTHLQQRRGPYGQATNIVPTNVQRKGDSSMYGHTYHNFAQAGDRTNNNEIYAILRDTQKQNNRSKIIKPSIIPIKSVEDVEAFEKSNDDEYNNVVQYLRNIGGFNAKKAITLCLKESIADSASVLFSWRGRKGLKALYNVRLVLAIFDAVCRNPYFHRPTQQDFQQFIREALRAAKERVRSKSRRPHQSAGQENDRDLWNNDWPEEEEEEVTD
ncbi:uncharacterized protein LOC112589245 isoform X2 [Harpegnathos saltator]|nr:uncharacterized protein LOC112589245 isoform X2 [Harpegnathos saltator]